MLIKELILITIIKAAIFKQYRHAMYPDSYNKLFGKMFRFAYH